MECIPSQSVGQRKTITSVTLERLRRIAHAFHLSGSAHALLRLPIGKSPKHIVKIKMVIGSPFRGSYNQIVHIPHHTVHAHILVRDILYRFIGRYAGQGHRYLLSRIPIVPIQFVSVHTVNPCGIRPVYTYARQEEGDTALNSETTPSEPTV